MEKSAFDTVHPVDIASKTKMATSEMDFIRIPSFGMTRQVSRNATHIQLIGDRSYFDAFFGSEKRISSGY